MSNVKFKIGYFADGPWSHNALDKLLTDSSIEIKFICARNDFPDPELKVRAKNNNIDFIFDPKINSEEFLDLMAEYNCDLHVSMSFNQIFKTKLINLPSFKTINCHAGKLPLYRGRNILNWALINDEKEFGITIHYVDEGIDTGDIILQNCYPISDKDDYASLLSRSYIECASNLYDAIKLVQKGKVNRVSQDDIAQHGFYCIARKKGDENLNWNQKSREIFNFIRAISKPGPQARTFLDEIEIKINKVECIRKAKKFKGIAGSVIGIEDNAFYVKTKDSFIKVTDWSGCVRPPIGSRFK